MRGQIKVKLFPTENILNNYLLDGSNASNQGKPFSLGNFLLTRFFVGYAIE